jgi:hypothetical protein
MSDALNARDVAATSLEEGASIKDANRVWAHLRSAAMAIAVDLRESSSKDIDLQAIAQKCGGTLGQLRSALRKYEPETYKNPEFKHVFSSARAKKSRLLATRIREMIEGQLATKWRCDMNSIAESLGLTIAQAFNHLRRHEKAFYLEKSRAGLWRKFKYPGGGNAIARDVKAMYVIARKSGTPKSVRKIAEDLGVSAWRAIVSLRKWEPEFYESTIKGRVGRASPEGKKTNIRTETKSRRLTQKQAQAELIFQRRIRGASWREAVEGTGILFSSAHVHIRAWGEKTGVEVSGAFTRRGVK